MIGWQRLNPTHVVRAWIGQDACLKFGRCIAAREVMSPQTIAMTPSPAFEVIDASCVACNLCNLCNEVCRAEDCITMERLAPGSVDLRTGLTVSVRGGGLFDPPQHSQHTGTAE
jgi:dihydropyrimidine dehydrogenase (NAD+) subunit PreA